MSNIYLIGMMGCGKSTVAKILASQTDKARIDLDKEIEKNEGMAISDIFKEKGEEYFRKAERDALKQVSEGSDQIIACGGGIILNPKNVELMRKSGTVVYLNREPENILKDIDTSKRPLLKSSAQNLKEIYEKREPLYKNAAHVVIDNNKTLEEAAQKITNVCHNSFKKK